MKVAIFILTLLLSHSMIFASSCPPDLDKSKPIDQLVSKWVDVDGDGISDKVELHLMAENFNSPFSWQLKIYSKGVVIYERNGNNKRIDQLFADPEYIGDCGGYDECKCRWYFQDFFDCIVQNASTNVLGVTDPNRPNSIYVIAREALRREAESNPSLVERAINEAAVRIRAGKAIIIAIFDEPEGPTPIMVWMPEFKRFVPIYEP
jgi:hypothetical protein